eukprot:5153874-Pleurochrysis_carterae.AAC.4
MFRASARKCRRESESEREGARTRKAGRESERMSVSSPAMPMSCRCIRTSASNHWSSTARGGASRSPPTARSLAAASSSLSIQQSSKSRNLTAAHQLPSSSRGSCSVESLSSPNPLVPNA